MKKTIWLSTAVILASTPSLWAVEELEKIVVSASKTSQKASKTTSNVEVIDESLIEQRGYKSLIDLLGDISSIATTQSGGIGQQSSLFLRGMTGGSTLVMIDGVRMNDASTTDNKTILENISLDNVKQIEIIKNGMGSIWGTNATAGVINIITKTPKDAFHGKVELGYGSHETYTSGANLSFKDAKFAIEAGASRVSSDGISALAPKSSEKDGMAQNTYHGMVSYKPNEQNSINLRLNETVTKANFDDTYNALGADDAYSHSDGKNRVFSLEHKYSEGEYESRLGFSKSKGDRVVYTTSPYGDGVNQYKFENQNYSWINRLNYTNGTIVGGIESSKTDGFQQYNTYPSSEAGYKDSGVFLSNFYHLTPTTDIETNLRYDHFDKFEDEYSYKVGLKQKDIFTPDLDLRVNYTSSFDAPSGYQMANPYPNITLKPSSIKGYEIGFNYDKIFDIAYFSNTIKDEFIWKKGLLWSDPYGYANANGDTTYNGVEISAGGYLNDKLSLNANYTKLFSMNELVTMANGDMGAKLRRAEETLHLSMGYDVNEKLSTKLLATYIGKRKDMDYNTFPAMPKETGNYTTLDFTSTYEIDSNLNFSFYLKNMFDKEYQSVYGYNSDGRTAEAKLRYQF